jgi:DNA polymerase
LAFAYGGGVGAWLTFAAAYNIDLDALTEQVYGTLPNDVRSEAENMYSWSVDTERPIYGMAEKTFIVCDGLKRVWRRAHPAICSMWPALENAAKQAINTTEAHAAGEHVSIVRQGAWLKMLLPSGDCLAYPSPKIEGAITYMGMNQYSRKWSRINTYGGKLFENLCQKFARNIMAYNMPQIDDVGYRIVLTVHDELITEAPDTEKFTEKALSTLLATPPIWAKTMPLAAAGFESKRYKKE